MGLLSSFVLCLGSGPIPGGDHKFSFVSGQILVFSFFIVCSIWAALFIFALYRIRELLAIWSHL